LTVNNTGGTPANRKITILNLTKGLPVANATTNGILNGTVDWVKFNASAYATDLTNHTSNATPHVSATNRTAWDGVAANNHTAVTLAGATYLTLGTQQITAGDVALTSNTSGNYVASVATTSPITGGAAGSEGATITIAIPQATAIASGYLNSTDFANFTGVLSNNHTRPALLTPSANNFTTGYDNATGAWTVARPSLANISDAPNQVLNTTSNVQFNNITVANITGTGWINTSLNMSAAFFHGNGSQLTGVASGANDTAYGAGWNGTTNQAPSQNAVYDKIESMVGSQMPADLPPTANNWTAGYNNTTGVWTVSRPLMANITDAPNQVLNTTSNVTFGNLTTTMNSTAGNYSSTGIGNFTTIIGNNATTSNQTVTTLINVTGAGIVLSIKDCS